MLVDVEKGERLSYCMVKKLTQEKAKPGTA
jgi:hypothetical protein